MTTLDSLARTLVGDGKRPNLYFVSAFEQHGGGVVAVFAKKIDALGFAEEVGAALVEDRVHGVVWTYEHGEE